jgi:hypothetical protein
MNKGIRRSCIQVRKVVRNSEPIVRRTGRYVERYVVKTSVVGFVPSVMNDVVIHHAQVTPVELFHIASDDVSVSSMTALAMALMRLL